MTTPNTHRKKLKWAVLTLTALRIDPMMNLLVGLTSVCASLFSPFCSLPSWCPFCSCSSGGLNGHVSSMSPSSRAIFSPLKLRFSYSTHLGEIKSTRGNEYTTSHAWSVLHFWPVWYVATTPIIILLSINPKMIYITNQFLIFLLIHAMSKYCDKMLIRVSLYRKNRKYSWLTVINGKRKEMNYVSKLEKANVEIRVVPIASEGSLLSGETGEASWRRPWPLMFHL